MPEVLSTSSFKQSIFLLLTWFFLCCTLLTGGYFFFNSVYHRSSLQKQNQASFESDFKERWQRLNKLAQTSNNLLIFIGQSTCARSIDGATVQRQFKTHPDLSIFNFCQEGDSHLVLNFLLMELLKKKFGGKIFGFVLMLPESFFNTFFNYSDIGIRKKFYESGTFENIASSKNKLERKWLSLMTIRTKLSHELFTMVIEDDPNFFYQNDGHTHSFSASGQLYESGFDSQILNDYSEREYRKIVYALRPMLGHSQQYITSLTSFLQQHELNKNNTRLFVLTSPVQGRLYQDYPELFRVAAQTKTLLEIQKSLHYLDISSMRSTVCFTDPVHFCEKSNTIISQTAGKQIEEALLNKPAINL